MTPDTPGVTVWRDMAGHEVVFGLTTSEWHWVRVDGVGSFRFALTSPDLRISADGVPEDGAPPELLVDSYYRTVVPMALHAYGLETLHGSSVAIGGGAVALCAPPRNGKSTIAFALGERGHDVLADDTVVLDLEGASGRPEVLPLPFELRLRRQSADHFACPAKDEVLVKEGRGRRVGSSLPLTAVVILSRGAFSLSLERLSRESAFKALLDQSQVFSVKDVGRKGAMMRAYLALAAAVPVYRLDYPSGLENLGEICSRIEQLARQGSKSQPQYGKRTSNCGVTSVHSSDKSAASQ